MVRDLKSREGSSPSCLPGDSNYKLPERPQSQASGAVPYLLEAHMRRIIRKIRELWQYDLALLIFLMWPLFRLLFGQRRGKR